MVIYFHDNSRVNEQTKLLNSWYWNSVKISLQNEKYPVVKENIPYAYGKYFAQKRTHANHDGNGNENTTKQNI